MRNLLKKSLAFIMSACIGVTCAVSAFAEGEEETEPLFNIEFIGDSICAGYQNYNTFNNVNIVNNGVGGYTTDDVLSDFDGFYGDYDKMLIICGVNDLGAYDVDEEEFEDSIYCYEQMFLLAKENMPDIHIYVTGILPTAKRYTSFIDNGLSVRFNKQLRELVAKYDYVTYCEECWDAMLDPETGYGRLTYYGDGLHPNRAGYAALTEVLEPYMYEDVAKYDTLPGSVGYQFKTDETTAMRFVAQISVDELDKADSGEYGVSVNGSEDKYTDNITKVYRSIYAGGKKIEAPEGTVFVLTPQFDNLSTGDTLAAEFKLNTYKYGLTKEVVA